MLGSANYLSERSSAQMDSFSNSQRIICQSALTDVCAITAERPCKLQLLLPPKKPVTLFHVISGRGAVMSGKQYRILSAGETILLRQHDLAIFYTQTGSFQAAVICAKPEAIPASVFSSRKEQCRQYSADPELTDRFSGTMNVQSAAGLIQAFALSEPDRESAAKTCPRAQMHIAVSAYACALHHPEQHISIHTLAEMLEVSPTHLKNGFRIVYGDSLYSYLRTQKMLAAATELRSCSRTVLDIAGDFGYDNGSKFAKAFQAVMGISPREYRTAFDPPDCSVNGVYLHDVLDETELE